jgi:hypothetical protein
MITSEKLRHGEGELVEGDFEIGSRRRTTQDEEMTPEGGDEHPFESEASFVDVFMTL